MDTFELNHVDLHDVAFRYAIRHAIDVRMREENFMFPEQVSIAAGNMLATLADLVATVIYRITNDEYAEAHRLVEAFGATVRSDLLRHSRVQAE
jgi:hypothetical protein